MNKQTIINTINDSKFSNDSELSGTVELINRGMLDGASQFFIDITYKETIKRIKTLENDSINLPTNLFDSYECSLIEDWMLDNAWCKEDINDANAYKGKYYVYDDTPNEFRVWFFKQDGDLFAEIGDDLWHLA